MPVSEARLLANRANALRSTGPRTPEGKAISRRNSLKHGMSGRGIVVPAVDSAEVERRSGAMLAEMTPRTEMGRFYVRRLAELTVRVERCARAERKAVEGRALLALEVFDEKRLAEVDHALGWIAAEPATHVRKLRSMPEGVDRLLAMLLEIKDELEMYGPARWEWHHGERLANLAGRRYMEVPVNPYQAYSEAMMGDFKFLAPGDGEGMDKPERIRWATRKMIGLIDEEIEQLLAHRETLDLEAIEEERAGAPERSMFDPSKEATLARRYEAAAERGVYKAWEKLQEVEAASACWESVAEAEGEAEALGSCGAEVAEAAPEREPAPARRPMPAPEPVRPVASTVSRPSSLFDPSMAGSGEGPGPVGIVGLGSR